MLSYNGGNRPKSKTTRMFRSVRHMAAPVGRQTLFGQDRLMVAPGRSLPSPTAYCCGLESLYISDVIFITSLPIGVRSIAISVSVRMYVCLLVCLSVRMSVCLSVHSHISETTFPNFTKFYVPVTCGPGSVLSCNMLYTSGFLMTYFFT